MKVERHLLTDVRKNSHKMEKIKYEINSILKIKLLADLYIFF